MLRHPRARTRVNNKTIFDRNAETSFRYNRRGFVAKFSKLTRARVITSEFDCGMRENLKAETLHKPLVAYIINIYIYILSLDVLVAVIYI